MSLADVMLGLVTAFVGVLGFVGLVAGVAAGDWSEL